MIPKPTSVWTCKGGNPVSALGVAGNGLWNKIIVAQTLKWPFRPSVSGDLHKKKGEKKLFDIGPKLATYPV